MTVSKAERTNARKTSIITPTSYMLASVNLALFSSSAWNLGHKINADFLSPVGNLRENMCTGPT